MSEITYDDVARLAEQLPPQEQKALIDYLQQLAQQRELNVQEWQTLLETVRVNIPPGPKFSNKRADWYDGL